MSLVSVEALELGRILIFAFFCHVTPKVGLLLGLFHISLGGVDILVQPLSCLGCLLCLPAVPLKFTLTILQLLEATFQLLLSPAAFLEVHLSLLLHLLRILGQLETYLDTEVLSHQLPLACKIIHLLEKLHKGLLLAELGFRVIFGRSLGQIFFTRLRSCFA